MFLEEIQLKFLSLTQFLEELLIILDNYTKTNVGHTISHFDNIFDDGASSVSGLSLTRT